MAFPHTRDDGATSWGYEMHDRHGREAVAEAEMASAQVIPGVSAGVVRRGLFPAYVVLLVAFLTLSAPRLAGDSPHLGAQLLWLAVAAAFARAAWVAYRSARLVERRFWGFMFVAAVCMVCSQTAYIVEIGASGGSASLVSISTALDLITVGVLGALLMSLTRFRRAALVARARFVVDLVAACVVTVGVLDDWVVGPLFESGGRTAVAGVLYSVYPVIGVLALVGVLRLVIGTRSRLWQSWERFLGAASWVLAATLLLSPVAFSDVAARATQGWAAVVADSMFLTSLFLGLAAVVSRLADRHRVWRLRPLAALEPSYGWVASVILPSIQLLAIPAFGIAAFGTADGSERSFRLAVVAVVALLLAVRTVLAVAESDALLITADTDPLTGLLNHRLFYDRLGSEMERAARHAEPLGLIALDIDDFASVNSAGGHLAGDAALVKVAQAVCAVVRVPDVVCRVGGDELMVILPGTDAGAALSTARRVLAGIAGVTDSAGRSLSASAGVVTFPGDGLDRDELVRRADAALYWAKRHGKTRAIAFEAQMTGPADAHERIRDVRDQANLDAVRALAAAVDAREPGTQDHSRNVAALATSLARELGLDERTVTMVGSAGRLHDVGKIGVPDAVLRRRGTLDAEERAQLLQHAALGAEILSATAMAEMLPWVRHHHERWDGTGSPEGLSGESIPLGARIIAVSEAYDSLITGRSGRKPLTRRAALQQIDLDLGQKFDPVVGERFLRMVARMPGPSDEGTSR